jgi:hypothetical protein
VQAKIVGGVIVAGESGCVELQVKNHSIKKVCASSPLTSFAFANPHPELWARRYVNSYTRAFWHPPYRKAAPADIRHPRHGPLPRARLHNSSRRRRRCEFGL